MCKKIDFPNTKDERDFKYQNKGRLCYCCDTLQESKDKIHILKIEGRKYGSIFDGSIIEFHLCNKCKEKIKEEWFNEIPIIIKYDEIYEHEENLKQFVDSFIIENQEYIYNAENIFDMPNYKISREEWIKNVKKQCELNNTNI